MIGGRASLFQDGHSSRCIHLGFVFDLWAMATWSNAAAAKRTLAPSNCSLQHCMLFRCDVSPSVTSHPNQQSTHPRVQQQSVAVRPALQLSYTPASSILHGSTEVLDPAGLKLMSQHKVSARRGCLEWKLCSGCSHYIVLYRFRCISTVGHLASCS